MIYNCPYCTKDFGAAELQQPAGVGGGLYCPHCKERVRLNFPYGWQVAIISLLVAIGVLAIFRVSSPIIFVIGIIVIWIPLSLYLNTVSVRYKPATLKKWKERRKTFFEWLHDRDAPRDIIDKRH